MKQIVFFGDSLTAGYGLKDPLSESLPALIANEIEKTGLDYQVINAGISGDTSWSGLARLDEVLATPVDVFVLELGANDLLRGYSAQQLRANLQKIIDKVRSAYPRAAILILGMELPAWISAPGLSGFRNIYHELASANNCSLVPFFLSGVAGVRHLNMYDGVHPLAEGYQVIAQTVWPALMSLLSEQEAGNTVSGNSYK